VVVKNVIEGGVEQVDLSTQCRDVEIRAVSIANTTTDGKGYDITLRRTGTGDDIGGIKIVISNGTAFSEPKEFGVALEPLETQTRTVTFTNGVTDPNKMELTVYFINDLGEVQICPITIDEEF